MYISYEVREALFYVKLVLLIVAIVYGAIIGLGKLSEASCKEIAHMMEVEYSYSMQTSCMIKKDGKWVPLQNLREI